MSQCLNPDCLYENPQGTSFCQRCGNKIILDDRYLPVKFIGEGGFGRTFQAVDVKRLNTPCVIKQFLPQQAGSSSLQKATELFQQEAKRLQELGKHPQIPDLLAFFSQDSRLYLIQEFIDGQNLLEELDTQGKFNESQIKNILTELLPVLQFIHDNKVIHRDIKPENIIRSKNGKLFLIDFGVSKETSSSIVTKIGTITGTPGYAPPEQFRGMVYPSSDLYSLAVTCVRLLTGLFQKSDGSDQLFDTINMEWQWQKYVSLSQELTDILETMLQDIPKKRYHSATEVLAALKNPIPRKTVVIPNPQPPQTQPSPNNPFKQILQQFISPPNNPPQPTIIKPQPSNAHTSFTEDLGNGVLLEMIAIRGGSFLMGSPENEPERLSSESPQHRVTIQPFYMGKFTVTQAQWERVAVLPKIQQDLNPNPSRFSGKNRPVEAVSWLDAQEFCARLSKATGKKYRLPSEAEWEYACRAGTNTPFYFGDNITNDLANYNGNYPYNSGAKGKYRQQTTDVGSFPPNSFGLYDMHGNVWEWCEDDWHENYINAPVNGSAWINQSSKYNLLRGGSWISNARDCRSANRGSGARDFRDDTLGFRVVVSSRTQ
ncbi:MAG: serine/threonine protein kinase [Nostocales cyanobacterium]|nr:MAG: serine/threonine protein kinase [Nostocales cyanobacterium]